MDYYTRHVNSVADNPLDHSDAQKVYHTAEEFYLKSTFHDALPWYMRCHELSLSGNPLTFASSKIKIASCYSFLDQSRLATETLNNAISILPKTESGLLADAYEGLGVIYLNRGMLSCAKGLFGNVLDKDLGERVKNEHPVIAGNAQYNLARIEIERMAREKIARQNGDRKGGYASTETFIERAVDLYTSRSIIGLANCDLARAITSVVMDQYSDAKNRLVSACELFEEARNSLGKAICHEILGDLYSCSHDSDDAIHHRDRAWIHYCESDPLARKDPWEARFKFEHALLRCGYRRIIVQ
jgi:tetratricopeptide (TPR) repeat protein